RHFLGSPMRLFAAELNPRDRWLSRVDCVKQSVVVRDDDLGDDRGDVLVVHGERAADDGKDRAAVPNVPFEAGDSHSASTSRTSAETSQYSVPPWFLLVTLPATTKSHTSSTAGSLNVNRSRVESTSCASDAAACPRNRRDRVPDLDKASRRNVVGYGVPSGSSRTFLVCRSIA